MCFVYLCVQFPDTNDSPLISIRRAGSAGTNTVRVCACVHLTFIFNSFFSLYVYACTTCAVLYARHDSFPPCRRCVVGTSHASHVPTRRCCRLFCVHFCLLRCCRLCSEPHFLSFLFLLFAECSHYLGS